MLGLNRLTNAIRSRFSIDWNNIDGTPGGGGIDSIDQTKKRRVPHGNVTSLDDEIKDRKRKQATLTGRSVERNFEVAAWAIRKHLDFVSSFSFQCKTGITSFDNDVEEFVRWWSRPMNFETKKQHGLDSAIRIAESMRCIDGDFHFLKIRNGLLQGIEADRILTPSKTRDNPFDEENTYNGVECAPNGPARRYAIHSRRRGGGLEFDRWVRTGNIFAHGFFNRFDQVRGVSPILASLSRYQDVYEGFDYALQRAKLSQLFGLKITRDANDNGFGVVEGVDDDGDGEADRYDVKLGTRPIVLDMNPGDDADFLENKTPAVEFQDFSNMMIGVALKALDIPFSFFDESYTNFFGSKAALTLYLLSARRKREDVKELLRQMTIWRLMIAIEDGDIVLPRQITTLDAIKFLWVPIGIPWFDPRDIRGDIDAIKAGLTTRTRVCLDRLGADWQDDIAPQLADEERLIAELGLNVTMDVSGASIAEDQKLEDVETQQGGVNR